MVPSSVPSILKSTPWDFEVVSNIQPEAQKQINSNEAISLEVEWNRARFMEEIQRKLGQLCAKRFNIKPPLGSYTQWFLEMKVHDKGADPLLPSDCSNYVSEAFMNDMLAVIPPTFHHTTDITTARAEFTLFTTWLTNMVKQNKCDPQLRKSSLRHTREFLSWLRDQKRADVNSILEAHHRLRCETQDVINCIIRPQIQEISSVLYEMSRNMADQLSKSFTPSSQEHSISSVRKNSSTSLSSCDSHLSGEKESKNHNAINSSSSSLSSSSTATTVTTVTVRFIHSHQPCVQLFYRNDQCTVSALHYQKLCTLHRKVCGDVDTDLLHQRIWCLLRRYKSFLFCDEDTVDGLQNQAALPVPVFRCLAEHFGVTFELFASPLNCFFPQYCSAFRDTDIYFGSRGPVLDFHPTSGSFEANPPFNEKLLENLALHLEHLLEKSSEPLSFIVILPDFRERPYRALELMSTSKFKRCDISFRDKEHGYRLAYFPFDKCGAEAAEMTQMSSNPTLLLFLQNDAGYRMWTPTPERMKALIAAYEMTYKDGQ